MGKLRSEINPKWLIDTITVDPGFGGTGWAYWLGNEFPFVGAITEPRKLKSKKKEERISFLFTEFRSLLQHYRPQKVIVETMQLWQGSLISQTAASRGDLFMTQTLVGGFCAIAQEVSAEFLLLTPQQWKGQLSKHAIASRIELINGKTYDDHIEDAVGIGFHIAGAI